MKIQPGIRLTTNRILMNPELFDSQTGFGDAERGNSVRGAPGVDPFQFSKLSVSLERSRR